MPARHRPRKNQNIQPKSKLRLFLFFGVLIIMVLGLLGIVFFAPKLNYFTVAVATDQGEIIVQVVDFSEGEFIEVIVPKDTQLELGMERGILRGESVWRLIESEKLPGQIISDTVMHSLHFPIDYWAHEGALENLLNPNTNLPFLTKVRLALLSKGKRREQIDLAETSYLQSGRLSDGEEGFVVEQNMPVKLRSMFADSDILEEQTVVNVINSTGEGNYRLDDVIGVLEVLGAKVAPVVQSEKVTSDCVVGAKNPNIRNKVARVFNCEISESAPKAFDVELTLGEKFLKRF